MTVPVKIDLRPSVPWALAVGLLHAAALSCAIMVLPIAATVLVGAGLAASAWHAVGQALLRGHRAVLALELHADGSLSILDGDAVWQRAGLRASGVIAPWLATLVVQSADGRRAVAVWRGMIDADAFRALRVWLRWRPMTGARRRSADHPGRD